MNENDSQQTESFANLHSRRTDVETDEKFLDQRLAAIITLTHLTNGQNAAPFPLDLQWIVEFYATRV